MKKMEPQQMALVWAAAVVLFGILEAATVNLVSLWFIAGALASLVAALVGAPLWLQVLLFFAVSVVLLAALRPLVKKYVAPRVTRTNADSLVGQEAVVTETIDNLNAQGQVKVNGMYWTARSTDSTLISPGATVVIRSIQGVKVLVDPVAAPVQK